MKAFEKEFSVKVSLTTFENEEEAVAKLTSGQTKFDVWWTTVDYVSRAVAGKLIQPINHSYLANLKNVWPSLQNPYYDQHSRYTVPYTIYTTGIAWRTDKLKKAPADYANPYDIFWDSHQYAGKVAILDDQREALGMTLLRRHFYDINTEDPKQINQGREGPLAAHLDRQHQGERERLHRHPVRQDLHLAGVVGRHRGRAVLPARRESPRRYSATGGPMSTPRRRTT